MRRWFSSTLLRHNQGNQPNLNPHSYFYKVLAVPLLKVGTVSLGTFYGLKFLWLYLEDDENDVKSEK
ncbi:hypothetical protein KL930_001737 [Ogataea haglerorum]|uniref:Uncharacterized protein n=1 Tax=Ogataea haglerorum TaxID=1937702 RepID=A0AAN6D8J6_9ASCO|nr:uncharacterized protein KL911_001678 [Ogataea haglerorum]KAG7698075.1 hypothetical protein KL915_001792 [Ogataea haglerorum]KAG7708297.1 hypothetical protein KL914_002023 [Ogataea haglerorum]KAG7729941.1 hypothetical protein KL933_001021 [Ogataea haglerorum]KAG7740173.1 hypothetical protein KL923_002014 [Ogataea haglerorum]KAG7755621.1 hypothetical protein KL911_001678 [Ogataea haglerorum]